jgi:Arc/MetJ-type ribon-helix-helix transcriptional regulator
MPKISVEVPGELLADLDTHVGSDGKFVNRSEAIRASIRKTLDLLDEIDDRHGRLEPASVDGDRPGSGGENDRDAHEDDGVRNSE